MSELIDRSRSFFRQFGFNENPQPAPLAGAFIIEIDLLHDKAKEMTLLKTAQYFLLLGAVVSILFYFALTGAATAFFGFFGFETYSQESDPILIMMEAVKSGVGRETAHEAIKEHAVATVKALREGLISENDLIDRLAEDQRLGLEKSFLQGVLESGKTKIGAAKQQVTHFVAVVDELAVKYPEAANYVPGGIL